ASCRLRRVSVWRVLPALAWTALIGWFSTASWSAAETGHFLLPALKRLLPFALPEQIDALHWLLRKTAHALGYGLLAPLWPWGLTRRSVFRGTVAALVLSIATAALDELHQATTLERTGSIADVLLDTTGAGATLILLSVGPYLAVSWLTAMLLWAAAGVGTALL